ncbi:MAG: ATP-binding protein [Candidatus Hodarchaeota archaeon]
MKIRKSKEFPGVEWIEDTEQFITINLDKCTGCANCVNVCLANCFEIVKKKVKIKSMNYCMECAACWYVCEPKALVFNWPKGGKGYRSDWG